MFRNATNKNAKTRLRGFEGLENRELMAADLFAAADSLATVEDDSSIVVPPEPVIVAEDPAMVVGPLDDTDLGDATVPPLVFGPETWVTVVRTHR